MKYVRNSFCGSISQGELDEMVDTLAEENFRLDDAFLSHIPEFHGGIPKTKFFGEGQIERMQNFADRYVSTGAKSPLIHRLGR